MTTSNDCRGRAPIYLSAQTAAVMTRTEKEALLAHNEALERQCGARAVTGTGGMW